MAVLSFYINQDKKSEVSVKLEKHKGETENDLSYKWGKYALSLAIQLNYNDIKVNPFSEDQGGQIHFISAKIRSENDLNEYGYENNLDEFDEFDEYYEDEDDYSFEVGQGYEHKDFNNKSWDAAANIRNDPDAVQVILDLHDASKIVGGLLTPTAISTNAVYEGTKEHSKELYESKINNI